MASTACEVFHRESTKVLHRWNNVSSGKMAIGGRPKWYIFGAIKFKWVEVSLEIREDFFGH